MRSVLPDGQEEGFRLPVSAKSVGWVSPCETHQLHRKPSRFRRALPILRATVSPMRATHADDGSPWMGRALAKTLNSIASPDGFATLHPSYGLVLGGWKAVAI